MQAQIPVVIGKMIAQRRKEVVVEDVTVWAVHGGAAPPCGWFNAGKSKFLLGPNGVSENLTRLPALRASVLGQQ
jgi:hypothetical protein